MTHTEEQQRQICQLYHSDFVPISDNEIIFFTGEDFESRPVIGCKITDWDEKGKPKASWFISCGVTQEEQEPTPISVAQLKEALPQVIPFLALEVDFNFLIDTDNQTDVWKED